MRPIKVYKVKDKTESFKKTKGDLFDLPMKLALVGKSELSGKTTTLASLLLLPEYYGGDFKGDHIYIVSPSANKDNKWKVMTKALKIPESNVFLSYDEEQLKVLYDFLEDEYLKAVDDGRKPKHTLIVFDDVGFSASLRGSYGVIDRLACNGRHLLISTVALVQKYTQLSTCFRENITGGIFFACSNKQLDLIYDDHGNMPKKEFVKMFRDATKGKHSFFVINYSNDEQDRYSESEKGKISS